MVTVEPTLVGWCPYCETYVDPYLQGEECPGVNHEHPSHRLRKRRMYICKECWDERGFFSLKAFNEHQHEHEEW